MFRKTLPAAATVALGAAVAAAARGVRLVLDGIDEVEFGESDTPDPARATRPDRRLAA